MQRFLRLCAAIVVVFIAAGCMATTKTQQPDQNDVQTGYPGKWEQATLTEDEFGFKLIVVRQNDEKWVLESKTTCFWTRQLVDRTVWLRWGPVESFLMNDQGQICEFWTGERME